MKQINILKLFKLLNDESYCLIKQSEIFPEYVVGSDFDIFCYDAISVSEKIVSFCNQYISKTVSVTITKNDYKVVVDIMENDLIHLRFDLYRRLPNFKQVSIRQSFFSSVIENCQTKKIGKDLIFVPSDIDEAILRYLEYHEWFAKRPDKIKHVEVIKQYILEKKIDELAFINKVHYYLKLPNNLDTRRVPKNSFLRFIKTIGGKFKRTLHSIKEIGLGSTFKLIMKRIIK
jgi:hypothetical protein